LNNGSLASGYETGRERLRRGKREGWEGKT